MTAIPIEDDPNYGVSTAEKDLNEQWMNLSTKNCADNPKHRESKIAELRKILKERNLSVKPGDDAQMLMLLRTAESNPSAAADIAANFIDFQRRVLEKTPSQLEEVLKSESSKFTVFPRRTKYGRRLLCIRLWDTDSCTPEQFMMVMYSAILLIAREPKTQIAGISVLTDLDALAWKHVPSWKKVTAYIKLFSGGAPVTIHDTHYINAPSLFKYLLKCATPLVPERIMALVKLHDDKDSVVAEFGAENLPAEFGGSAGGVDGSGIMKQLLTTEDYFVEVRKSSADAQGTSDANGNEETAKTSKSRGFFFSRAATTKC